MNLCGVCSPRPFVAGDRTRHAQCDGCGIQTDCVIVDPNPVPIAPRAAAPGRRFVASGFPARTRLVPSLRMRR